MGKLSDFISLLSVVQALLPIVVNLVKSLEDVDGDGPSKLQTVLTAVKTAYDQTMTSGIDWSKIEPVIKVWSKTSST